ERDDAHEERRVDPARDGTQGDQEEQRPQRETIQEDELETESDAATGHQPAPVAINASRALGLVATDERESVVAGSRVVESHEAELSAAGVGPEADDVAAAEEAEPRLVQEHDRPLALHVRIGGAEVERILVLRPREVVTRGLRNRVLGADLAIEREQDDLADRRAGGSHGEIVGRHARVGIAVVAGRHQLLRRSPIAGPDSIGERHGPKTSRSSPVMRAAGSVRIFRSSSPRTWKRPSSALLTT